ncbi:type I-E CRISPR-associated protein Cas7/Cse4/CasC [Arcanobacterium pinnipediorum]|uniref:Type I-E CRISPR-associated protein Cas7/Cse4/CasC n=1 Tax=Arcanobacterium pinnipediorum TaxID=1503041 RepID=A0ABY5AGN4_9ACTO|nr:type I-E CRISPR-associated protein Cas7/Cse4/CasC [Arcanobacterium pinnipediorum]USR79354.1 type I-E CRISPR-associated protein Cas7/Cse4/CasC [Arcanobacterium pinnipediorum]
MAKNLTLHIISNVPYSNLNRDDSGTPKRLMLGGALRAMHSSQSIKRGIRGKYEEASLDLSVRSGKLVDEVLDIATKLNPEIEKESLRKPAAKRIGELTKSEAAEKESDRSAWLSVEELTTLAQSLIDGEENNEYIADGKTGSLAIAAFGRMFANAPEKNTEAAISVSPGVTTHAATIESDYFSTGDDVRERNRESGATYLGVSRYVNGTFYRTISIDKDQLKAVWTAFELPETRDNLREFIRAAIYGMPRGKENSTAPYTMPSLVLAEEQRYRTAYSFEKPVLVGPDGGYEAETIKELAAQYQRARSFDPHNFGPVEVLSGTAEFSDELFAGVERDSLDGMIDRIVDWILQ